MKKGLKIIYIFLLIIAIKLFLTFILNEIFISKYNDGEYRISDVKKVGFLNVTQTYIAHYNYGNVLYKNGDYDKAIEKYKKALKSFPPKKKECNIRINLALAMLSKIDVNNGKEEVAKILLEARNILCEDGCANENDNNGHNKKAEELKRDIDNAIKELQNESQSGEERKEDEEEENKDDDNKRDDKKTIEEQLKEIQKEGREERTEELDSLKQMQERDYSYDKKTW